MATRIEASAYPLSGQMEIDALLRPYAPWDFTTDNVIHYTFEPSDAEDWLGYSNVHAYDAATQDAVRVALTHAAAITGITFAEITDSALAELHFVAADIFGFSGVFTSRVDWNLDATGEVTSADVDGYVVLHSSMSNVAPGTFSYQVLLHEVGHGLGLKHPHDPELNLFPTDDNTDNTLMSYHSVGAAKTEFQEYDLAALDWIYGGDGVGGAGAFQDGVLRKFGTTSDETMAGGPGHDNLFGNLGNDALIGGAGNDLLDGGSGADSMDGGEGDDSYVVSTGDVLADSSGIDWVFSDVSWALGAGFENLLLYSDPWGAGDTATGNDLDNRIAGNERDNLITGGAGNDTFSGGNGLDRFLFAEAPGGANADLITDFDFGWQDELVFDASIFTAIGETSFSNADARFLAGPGAVSGQDASDRVIYDTDTGQVYYDADGSGGGAALLVVTLQNAPVLDAAQIEVINGQEDEGMEITGTSGNDTLVGTDSNDTIDGLGGNDAISGQGGDDLMLGGGGSDQFNMTTGAATSYGNDTIDGGAGTDSLFFNYFGATGVVVDFGTGTATGGLGGTGSVAFSSIERVVATASDDHLIGAAGGQNLSGLGGSDTLEGGAGNDTLYGGGGSGIDRFTFRETGAANADSIRDFAASSDMIVLDGAVMTELGASGAFTASDGRFWAAAGASSGHDADDRIIYNTSTRQLFYDADGNGSGAAQLIATLQSGATLGAANIEVINGGGGGGGEAITGTAGNDTLVGTAGDDTIDGLAGNDSLSGLGGDDELIGGSGTDTLDGGTGADTMQGGLQDDLYIVDDAGDEVVELEGGGSNDHVQSSVTYTLPAWVNNLTLTETAAVHGNGNELDNVLTGNGAANFLIGGDGNDTIIGGDGNDHLEGDFHGGVHGDDHISGGAGDDSFNGRKGDDTLLGGSGDDGFQIDLADDFVFDSREPGNDRIEGGDGVDRINFSTEGISSTDAVVIDLAAGTYTIDHPMGVVNGIVIDVETVQGSWFADSIRGSAGANAVDGRDGNDLIEGRAGNDTLAGSFGIDTLVGGEGNDTLTGDDDASVATVRQDRFLFDAAPGPANSDVITDFEASMDKVVLDGAVHADIGASGAFGAGDARFAANPTGTAQDSFDRVVYNTSTGELWYDADGNGTGPAALIATLEGAPALAATDIEVVNGSTGGGGDTIVGTEGDDTLVGTEGDDSIDGLGGNDDISGLGGNDTIDGGAGSDTMDGGLGDDTYHIDFGDVVTDAGGMDTVISDQGTLPDGIENFIVRPVFDDVSASGNGLDNLIRVESDIPNSIVFLHGAGGDDTIIGGDESDFFLLSAGNDSVDGGGGINRIQGGSVDFRNGTASSGSGTTTFTNVSAAYGSLLADTLIADDAGRGLEGREGNDTVIGGAGDDSLWGDGGFGHPDTLQGDDHVTGGAGNDLLVGGAGNDMLEGGAGNDTLRGAGDGDDGMDRFEFRIAPGAENADVVQDFVSGADTVLLDGIAHASIGASGDFAAGDARFRAGASAQDADDRVIYNGATGELWYDADGNGGGTMQLIATLEGAPTLAATDITVENGGGGGNPGEEITGTGGNDTLTGTEGDDTINGLGGNDVILAGATGGTDVVDGGAGRDSIEFKGAATSAIVVDFVAGTITGGSDGSITFASIERVVTGNFDDQLTGDGAAQNLTGQAGSDTIAGAGGVDTLWGGGGDDEFIFRETGNGNADRISDFSSGNDTIALDNAVMTALGADGDFVAGDARFHAAAGATGGADAADRVVYNISTGQLYYDADGSGGGAAQLIATVQGAPGVSATDISVI